eukprot:2229282-Pleurochrysis_carterae.AAC.2
MQRRKQAQESERNEEATRATSGRAQADPAPSEAQGFRAGEGRSHGLRYKTCAQTCATPRVSEPGAASAQEKRRTFSAAARCSGRRRGAALGHLWASQVLQAEGAARQRLLALWAGGGLGRPRRDVPRRRRGLHATRGRACRQTCARKTHTAHAQQSGGGDGCRRCGLDRGGA